MQPKEQRTIEIKDVLSVALRRKWLIILPILLVTGLTFGGTFLLEERFQSSTMVVIDQTKYLSRQLQAMVPGQDDERYRDQQSSGRLIAIRNEIVSTSYLSRLINEMQLYNDPNVLLRARKLQLKRPEVSVDQLIYHILIQELRKNLYIRFNGENIIEITAESSDPTRAMNIAAKLAEVFKDERLKRELSGVRGAMDFSDEQLAIYRNNLEEAEAAKANFMAEKITNQLNESVMADSNINAIRADIDNIKLQIDANIEEQTRLRSELAEYSRSELQIGFGREYQNLKEDAFEQSALLADFMSKYTWSDPKVLNANLKLNNNLREMERIVEEKVAQHFSSATPEDQDLLAEYFSMQTREEVLRRKKNDYDVALSTLRTRIAQQPEIDIQLRTLENNIRSAREVFEKFKEQLTGSEISQSLMRGEAESKYRIMEPASVPLDPVKPERIKLTMLGLVLGLVLGGAAALLAELLDNSFKRIEDVEEFLNMPVLATIPNISSIKGKIKVS